MTIGPSGPTEAGELLARKERYDRPRVFYPYMVSCTEPRPLSRESATRRTVSLSASGECLSLYKNDSILTSHLSRAIIGGMKKQRKATTLRLEEQDIKALETLKQYYGIGSDNQAIILAIQLVARQIEEGRASSPAPEKGTPGSSPP
jgi:hypothetical protein